MATKMNKSEGQQVGPVLVVDTTCGISFVGLDLQLDWHDIKCVVNDKYDVKTKGMVFDAITFMTRGGLKFRVRKEDVVWAEDQSAADIEDMRGFPTCKDDLFVQTDCSYEDEATRKTAEKNLKWAIEFVQKLRGKSAAVKVCEDSLLYEICECLKKPVAEGDTESLVWFKPLEEQMRIVLDKSYEFKGDAEANDKAKRACIAVAFRAAEQFFSFGGPIHPKKVWERMTMDLKEDDPERKRFETAGDHIVGRNMRKEYDAFRNARAWLGVWDSKADLEELYHKISGANLFVPMIVCSDKPGDLSTIAGMNIPNVLICSKFDLDFHNAHVSEDGDRPAVFPEGHPKEGCIYVQDPDKVLHFTELTKTNTGIFKPKEIEEILAKLDQVFYKSE